MFVGHSRSGIMTVLIFLASKHSLISISDDHFVSPTFFVLLRPPWVSPTLVLDMVADKSGQ